MNEAKSKDEILMTRLIVQLKNQIGTMQHFKEALDLIVCNFMSLKKDLRELVHLWNRNIIFLVCKLIYSTVYIIIYTSTLGKP